MKKLSIGIVFVFVGLAVTFAFQNCARVDYQVKSLESLAPVDASGSGTNLPPADNGGPGTTDETIRCQSAPGVSENRNLLIEGPSVLQVLQIGKFIIKGIDACNNIKSYVWSAGDGSPDVPGLTSEFEHSYGAPGIYRVRSDILDDKGQIARTFHRVSVPAKCMAGRVCNFNPKDVFITGPDMGRVNTSYKFELMIPDGYTLVSAQWDFKDGSPIEFGLPAQNHSYVKPGVYDIAVLIEGPGAAKETIFHRITIIDDTSIMQCPIEKAGISSPTIARVNKDVPFYLALPHCLLNQFVKLDWNFGDGGTGGPVQFIKHKYKLKGYYRVVARLYKKQDAENPDLTLVRWIQIVDDDSGHHCDDDPPPGNYCPVEGQSITSLGSVFYKDEKCGVDGMRKDTYRDQIVRTCKKGSAGLVWVETSRVPVLQSKGKCLGQSCLIPKEAQNQIEGNAPGIKVIDGMKYIIDGSKKTFYSNMQPAGKCSEVSMERECKNGELTNLSGPCVGCGGKGKVAFYIYLICNDGCPGFGVHGTTKTNVVSGELKEPKMCKYQEPNIFDIFERVIDQTCQMGKVVNSNEKKGKLIKAGICPTYKWVPTNNWSACTADCGGTQTQIFECHDKQGMKVANDRCEGSAPVINRVCDGKPNATKTETVNAKEEVGSCTACPANEIGIVIGQRTVSTTNTLTCVDHKYKVTNTEKTYSAWSYETFCRPFETVRCSHDSLDNTQAAGRYAWMVKCQNQVPVIKEFLQLFKDVEFNGKDSWGNQQNDTSLTSSGRKLYATFMDASTGKAWVAPKTESASCEVPAKAYVAAVCVSSCATPEQQILASNDFSKLNGEVTFIEALTKKLPYVAVAGSFDEKENPKLKQMKVDQWVTELLDSEHEVLMFTMQSGGKLRVTPNHALIDGEGVMREASSFEMGDELIKQSGERDPIVSIERQMHKGKVYHVFIKSGDPEDNVVITNGYLNGSAFYLNEGAKYMNREVLRSRLIRDVIK